MKIIDPHLHLFDLTMGDYHWLKADNPPQWPDKEKINKSFHEADLQLNANSSLAGFVHIEAGYNNDQPWREILWLEQACQQTFRSVAAIDITLNSKEFQKQLTKLLTYKSVVGCRYILDDEAVALLSNTQVQENLALLAQHQLSFDAQLSLANKNNAQALVRILTLIPKLKIIINHAGWPPSNNKTKDSKQWLTNIELLAEFPQCAIKCSGWEMVDRTYQHAWLIDIINHCLCFFGEDRVMLASNFPLCLFHGNYATLWHFYCEELSISSRQLELISYNNAFHWYKF